MTSSPTTATFGPQEHEILAALHRLESLTAEEIEKLHAAHQQFWGYTTDSPPLVGRISQLWLSLRNALEQAGRGNRDVLGPVFEATRQAIAATGTARAQFAIRDLTMALSARDLVGSSPGWDQEGYGALAAPWIRVLGETNQL